MQTLSPDLLAAAEAAIRETGDFIRGEWANFSQDKIESKGRNDLVSYVDREAEKMLEAAFSALIPDSGFIMEESGDKNPHSSWRWIIDPLDGTTNFMHGVPAFAVSVALQHKEETLAGWVLDVPHDQMFMARKGEGAFQEGKSIRVSPVSEFSASLMATGFPYSKNALPADYLTVLGEFVKHTHGVRRFGAAALDLVWVASGRFGGFYEVGLKPWDVAAGALIVSEAGGRVSDFSGTQDFLFGKQIVASTPGIHADMLRVLADFRHLMRN